MTVNETEAFQQSHGGLNVTKSLSATLMYAPVVSKSD
jgi:hypothetical protein